MRTKPEELAEALQAVANRLELLEAENRILRGLLNVPSEHLEAFLRYEREKTVRGV